MLFFNELAWFYVLCNILSCQLNCPYKKEKTDQIRFELETFITELWNKKQMNYRLSFSPSLHFSSFFHSSYTPKFHFFRGQWQKSSRTQTLLENEKNIMFLIENACLPEQIVYDIVLIC